MLTQVLSVARDSEGSQGKRFEVHPTGTRDLMSFVVLFSLLLLDLFFFLVSLGSFLRWLAEGPAMSSVQTLFKLCVTTSQQSQCTPLCRQRYRHNGTSNGKGKEGKERRNGSHSGYSYASGTIENTGVDTYDP